MNNKLPLFFGLLALASIAFFIGSRGNHIQTAQDNKLHIVASFYPMYFFATQIGGEKVTVYNITPASAEPHDYEPTSQDVARIEQSSVLVLNGGAIESWGTKIKDDLRGRNIITVIAGDSIVKKKMDDLLANSTSNPSTGSEQSVATAGQIQDPHVWQDPILAKEEVANIEKGLEKADPQDKLYFQTNAKKLDTELDQLNNNYKAGLARCKLRNFVTSHAAFAYMAKRYDINQIAISGVSPDEEPSSQKLAEITNLVKKEGITVIFFESLVSPKLSDTIASETGAKTLVLDPLEGVTQKDAQRGANYFSVMQQNLTNLQIALQCSK